MLLLGGVLMLLTKVVPKHTLLLEVIGCVSATDKSSSKTHATIRDERVC